MIRPTFATSIRIRSFVLAALALVCLSAPKVLYAQDAKLPDAEKILDKYVEVTGGKDAYAKLNNRVTKATLDFTAQGFKAKVTIYAARPNKLYSVAEAEAFGKIEKGTNGEVVWEKSMMTGAQIKEGDEKASILRSAEFDAVTNWRKLHKKVECVGVEEVDGKPCYKIVMTPNDGEPETRYYDQKSGLLVKTEMKLKMPMGLIPMEIFASDYKKVDGVLVPHKARVSVMGQERIMTTDSIEHNVELPADCFAVPEEIKQMLKDKPDEKPATAKP